MYAQNLILEAKNNEIEVLKRENQVMKRKFYECADVLKKYKIKIHRFNSPQADSKRSNEELTPHELDVLKAFPISRKSDREFVSAALKMLYKNNADDMRHLVLSEKSITQTTKSSAMVIAPEKLHKIYSLVSDRAKNIPDLVERIKREDTDYVNSIISRAFFLAKSC